MIVGFIGFGEAAFAIASGLREAGVEQMIAYDAFRSEQVVRRAKQIGVELQDKIQSIGERASLIFSLVTSSSAHEVAEEVVPFIQQGAVYADLNSCSPKAKRGIGDLFSETGALFTCVAVMSAVPPLKHRVPMLADGPGAPQLKRQMEAYGMQIEVVDGPIGSAAVKMCRSVIVKGMEALFLEALLAADSAGVVERVLASADASFGHMTLSELANYLVVRNLQHGHRRAHELAEAAETVAELGYEPLVTRGAAQRLAWSASKLPTGGQEQRATSFWEVLEVLKQDPA
ncbi:DUF1932 domain-containing protein [Alicyclobacillus fastidiosus]|uniref:DUF1932 domain-containing protein n=1 Tax=Alicyclobacillus fastidiosus TaxID=392011 RepID=A0ABY6ZI51_9BACL|nr:NAD(P)-dependent oxidoreductase [Alicyclobacillus fastidiosus]WAH42549.1 DUF1932 domain-containing protein [Alicyclobacillus fastidiosus]GMA64397.1 dehydrogenase [Alicyclobacillus fastidiosus]